MSAGDPSVEKLRERAYYERVLAIVCRRSHKIGGPSCDKTCGFKVNNLLRLLRADRDRLLETFEKLAETWRAERAHTYASENAERYRGFDAGKQRCAESLKAAINAAKGGNA